MAGFDISFLNQSWGFILTIALLGGILWRASLWLNNQQDLKLKNKQAMEDTRALELKGYTDEKARDLKDTALKMADDVKASTAKLADDYRMINAKHIDILEKRLTEYIELSNKNISNLDMKLTEFYTKTTEKDTQILALVTELTSRANTSSDKVSNIRKDLLELAEELDIITQRDGKSMGDAVRSSKKARGRRRKLDEINEDDKTNQRNSVSDILD